MSVFGSQECDSYKRLKKREGSLGAKEKCPGMHGRILSLPFSATPTSLYIIHYKNPTLDEDMTRTHGFRRNIAQWWHQRMGGTLFKSCSRLYKQHVATCFFVVFFLQGGRPFLLPRLAMSRQGLPHPAPIPDDLVTLKRGPALSFSMALVQRQDIHAIRNQKEPMSWTDLHTQV